MADALLRNLYQGAGTAQIQQATEETISANEKLEDIMTRLQGQEGRSDCRDFLQFYVDDESAERLSIANPSITFSLLPVCLRPFLQSTEALEGLSGALGVSAGGLEKICRILISIADHSKHVSYDSFILFVDVLAALATRVFQSPSLAIPAVQRAIQSRSVHAFTPAHVVFVRLCVEANDAESAWSILQFYLKSIDMPMKSQLADLHYFLFHAGVLCHRARQDSRALDFFWNCMTSFVRSNSPFINEAAKKYLLLSLILHGKVSNIATFKNMRSSIPIYVEFLDLWMAHTGNQAKLRTFVNANQSTFHEDGNIELVLRCLDVIHEHHFLRLGSTYSTLTVHDAQKFLGFETAEQFMNLLNRMIAEKKVPASILGQDGALHFDREIEEEEIEDSSFMQILQQSHNFVVELERVKTELLQFQSAKIKPLLGDSGEKGDVLDEFYDMNEGKE